MNQILETSRKYSRTLKGVVMGLGMAAILWGTPANAAPVYALSDTGWFSHGWTRTTIADNPRNGPAGMLLARGGRGGGGGGGSGQCDGSGSGQGKGKGYGYGAKDGTGTGERPQDGSGYGAGSGSGSGGGSGQKDGSRGKGKRRGQGNR
ncbi:MAG: hypothetical protein R6U38_08785 [Desulfatiglandaceae bacterium]